MKHFGLKNFRSWYFRIWWWFWTKSPIYICLNPFSFLSDWWRVRKVFRRPRFVVHKNPTEYLGNDYIFVNSHSNNKWLTILSEPCGWKSKYREVRFETVPYFAIYWRTKLKLLIGLECPIYDVRVLDGKYNFNANNLLYWEGLLTYSFSEDLIKAFEENIWEQGIDKTNYKLTIVPYLKPKYVKKLIEHYDTKQQ